MRKFIAAAAGVAAASMMAPVSADVEYPVCFEILDQLYIEANSDDCTLEVAAWEMVGNQGPYFVEFDASGNLLCTALEVKYVNNYVPIAGNIIVNALSPLPPFPLTGIGPDEVICEDWPLPFTEDGGDYTPGP